MGGNLIPRRSILREAIVMRRRSVVGFMPLWFGRGRELKRLLDDVDEDVVLWLTDGKMFADAVEWMDVGSN